MVVKNDHPGKHEGLEKLMLKIGVFSSLYLVRVYHIIHQMIICILDTRISTPWMLFLYLYEL